MVAVVCGPAEGELGEVSSADYDTVFLVGDVHEQLGALPCL